MKQIATLTIVLVMMTGITFADEITRTTEQRSATVTAEPGSPPPGQGSASSSRIEEQTSSTSAPLQPTQQETTTGSRIEERSATVVVPPAPVQQKTSIEKRSSTTTSE